MRLFDVTGCAAQIVRPGMNLTAWTAQNRPFAVCNASLYDFATRIPIGTIIENGKFIHNDGNGYGCGTVNGTLRFGKPWDGTAWDDYITGYISPVQNGVYVAPTFRDSYVFDCRLSRIGIGKHGAQTFIVVDDYVNLREFAMNAIGMGLDTLVNLDGGGSRHLFYDGKAVYSSPRVPYNAIAFFKNTATAKPEPNKCPYPEPTRNLILWSRGDDVKWLQWHLNERGYCSGVIDGIFGWNTWNALFAYQKTWSRFPDGICGPNTRGHINGQI